MRMSVLSIIGKFHHQQHVGKILFLIRKRGLKCQSAVIFKMFEPIYADRQNCETLAVGLGRF